MFGKVNMATWKVVLVVIGVGILLMLIGMWLGYRYISEQNEIQPKAQHEPSNMEPPLVLIHHVSKNLLI